MQTSINIALFGINIFCFIAVLFLRKWSIQQEEDLLDYGSVSNQQYANLYEEMVQERNKLLDIVEKNERKTEMLLDFILNSLPNRQVELFHLYHKRHDLVNKRNEVLRRLKPLQFGYDCDTVERQSLFLLKNKLDKEIRELNDKIKTLEKEINA